VTAILQRITARFFDQKLIHFDVSATTSHHQDIIDQPMPWNPSEEKKRRDGILQKRVNFLFDL
jgi:hypothetical protein